MKCPNCGKKMKYKHGIGNYIDFSGTAEDGELEYYWEEYDCNACHITYDGENWDIPDKYKPTEKQIRTILFINNHLNMDLKALTKHQCWIDIGRYFEEAKNTPLYSDEYFEDMQEFLGSCEGNFLIS